MRHLQRFHRRYEEKGLVLLGFNGSDRRDLAKKFFFDHGVNFPSVLDTSEGAAKVLEAYKCTAIPLNCIIDREGKVVDAWHGYIEGHERAKRALRKLGIED